MDSSGDRMPLPDASKKSPRVYTNLQNTDLDNVTFANVQSTGNPIAVEELNEDEMRRLVLVNLARLVCAGEWNGLLTAATSAAYLPAKITGQGASFPFVPYNGGSADVTNFNASEGNYYASPFVAPDGDLALETGTATCQIYVQTPETSGTFFVGIYSNGSDNAPDSLLSSAEFDVGSAGLLTSAWSDAVTLSGGTQYWCAWLQPNGQTGVQLQGVDAGDCRIILFDDDDMASKTHVGGGSTSSSTLPSSFASPVSLYSSRQPKIGFKVA